MEKTKPGIDWDLAMRLMRCFPGSFINQYGEFVAHKNSNAYFNLISCTDELDVKCKTLEWFSREAYKSQPFSSGRSNAKYNQFMLDGINAFLNTRFVIADMDCIYSHLGNGIRHDQTIEFIKGGYNMGFFERFRK